MYRIALATLVLAGCEFPSLFFDFGGHLSHKDTVSACLPEAEYPEFTPGARLEGFSLASGVFLGGPDEISSAALPSYSMGPSTALHRDLAAGDPEADRVTLWKGQPDGRLASEEEIRSPWQTPTEFGFALAARDIDPGRTPRMEIAIGAPGAKCQEAPEAGAVQLCALTAEDQVCCMKPICNPAASSPRGEAANDRFGESVVFGNFDRDEAFELAVGAPNAKAGRVYIFELDMRSKPNPRSCADLEITAKLHKTIQLPPARSYSRAPRFGAALEAGQFEGASGQTAGGLPVEALAVGMPGGGGTGRGLVKVFTTVSAMLDTDSTLSRTSFPDDAGNAGGDFGAALSSGDLNGNGVRELIIGAPTATLGGHKRLGEVCHTADSRSPARCISPITVGARAHDDQLFGSALAVGNFDGAALERRDLDLAVGMPGRLNNKGDAVGGALVFFGGGDFTDHGLTTTAANDYDTLWMRPRSGQHGARSGTALAAMSPRGGDFDDLALGQPGFQGSGPTGGVQITRGVENFSNDAYADGDPIGSGIWSGGFEHLHGTERWKVRVWEDPRAIEAGEGGGVNFHFGEDAAMVPIWTDCNLEPLLTPEILEECGEHGGMACPGTIEEGTPIELFKKDDPRTQDFVEPGCFDPGYNVVYSAKPQHTTCRSYWLRHQVTTVELVQECTPDESAGIYCYPFQLYAHATQFDPLTGEVLTWQLGGRTHDNIGEMGVLCIGPTVAPIIFDRDPSDTKHLHCE